MSDGVVTAGPVREVFTEGAGFQPADPEAPFRVVVSEGSRTRVLPPSILAKIDGKLAPAEPAPAATAEPAKDATAAPAPDKPADTAKPAETASAAAESKAEAAPAASAPDVAALTAERDRYLAANQKLAAELEAARKAPATATQDDGGDDYVTDSIGALRKQVARWLGVDDPQSPEVTAEISALTGDLTSHVHGVQLDATQQAARDAAKARQALARDKKTRKAESDAATKGTQAQAEVAKAQEAAAFIGNRLSHKREDGKSLIDEHPLAKEAAAVHGRPLEALVLEIYQREAKAGRFDPARAGDDDYLIAETLKVITNPFQDLLKRHSSSPSTAQQTPATVPAATTSASQATPHGHGGRTLTTADSSVAPATPPSTTPSQPKRPKSRAEYLAQRFPDD